MLTPRRLNPVLHERASLSLRAQFCFSFVRLCHKNAPRSTAGEAKENEDDDEEEKQKMKNRKEDDGRRIKRGKKGRRKNDK
jgi:hypothetical protein